MGVGHLSKKVRTVKILFSAFPLPIPIPIQIPIQIPILINPAPGPALEKGRICAVARFGRGARFVCGCLCLSGSLV